MTDPRQQRSLSFGAEAAAYERGRPSYPPEAIDWLLPANARRITNSRTLNVAPGAPSTLTSTEPPTLTLCAVAKPARPPFATESAPVSFQPLDPG